MGAWAAGCGQVKPDATDAVAAAPVHHKVVLENDVVRVLDVTVPLYSAEPPHTHFWPSVFFEQTSAPDKPWEAVNIKWSESGPVKGYVRSERHRHNLLIELKNDAFKHEHLGQLNSYVDYYQKHEMAEGDQPPVGILLCTRKNEELVEYALAGMSNQLFVSRYQVQLPDKAQMAAFLHQALAELGGDPAGAGTG